jgi:YggT family protein
MINILYQLIHALLGLYIVVLVVHVVISWLYAFDVVGRGNQAVYAIWNFTKALTEPVLRPLRKIIPTIGGVDLSVLVLVLVLALVRDSVLPWLVIVLRGGPVL